MQGLIPKPEYCTSNDSHGLQSKYQDLALHATRTVSKRLHHTWISIYTPIQLIHSPHPTLDNWTTRDIILGPSPTTHHKLISRFVITIQIDGIPFCLQPTV
jgi:hypothetical protein